MFSNRKKLKLQGKDKAHAKALIKSQIIELIRNGRIKTTPTKAKALKSSFDKLVTMYKKNTEASKKIVISRLGENKRAFTQLEKVVKEKLGDRNSGYTRIIKTLSRPGDNAKQAYIMLMNTEFEPKKSKIKKVLKKQEQSKKSEGIGGRIKGAVENAAKINKAQADAKDIAGTGFRRNSK